jgi:VCBS repeat-containing protein
MTAAAKINPSVDEFLVNTTTTKNQDNATGAYLSDGRFVAVWGDTSASGSTFPHLLKGQVFDSSGNKSGGEFAVDNGTGDHQHSSLTALTNGGFVVTWMEGIPYQIRFQVYDSAIAHVGTVVTLSNPMFALGAPSYPDVTALANGNFVVTWADTDSHDAQNGALNGIFAQTFSAAGTAIDSAHLLNTTVAGEQRAASVSALASGGYVALWEDNPTATSSTAFGGGYGVTARVFAADGTPVTGETAVTSSSLNYDSYPEVEGLVGGGFVAIWSVGGSVHGQLFDSAGAKVGGDFQVNSTTATSQYGAKVAGLPNGSFIVAWSDSGPDADGSIRAQVFNPDGSRQGSEQTVGAESSQAYDLVIDVRSDSSWAIAWGASDGAGFTDVKGRFFSPVPDDPAVAADDSVATAENAVKTGSLFADNGHGVDSDADGPSLQIGSVNGSAANVGQTIVLNSGAKLTVGADGSYSYDPNGAYNSLADSSTGAVNSSGTDSFTYTLAGGGSATVTVTIAGVASPGDFLRGDSGDNVITGTSGADFFRLENGGDDHASGAGGGDAFYFGASYTSADFVDGGSGSDQVALQGDYSSPVTLGTLTGVETLVAMTHSDVRFGGGSASPYSYNIVATDDAVAAGTQLLVNASTLEAGENLTFDGHLETNGSFFIYGGKGVDTLTGGSGADVFFFAEDGRFAATDHIDGGAGLDAMVLRGNYTLTLSGTSIVNVETVVLNSGSDARFYAAGTPFSYDVTTADDTVAAGQTMTFNGGQLSASETLHFDGSLETNGNFRLFGGSANDVIKGGAGSDLIYGGRGGDVLTGGAGADVFWLKSAAESSSTHYDTLMDFDYMVDRIDLPFTVSGIAQHNAVGTVNLATFDADIAGLVDQELNPYGLIEVTTDPNSDIGSHVFLVVDADGDGAYQADHDYVFDITHTVVPPATSYFI